MNSCPVTLVSYLVFVFSVAMLIRSLANLKTSSQRAWRISALSTGKEGESGGRPNRRSQGRRTSRLKSILREWSQLLRGHQFDTQAKIKAVSYHNLVGASKQRDRGYLRSFDQIYRPYRLTGYEEELSLSCLFGVVGIVLYIQQKWNSALDRNGFAAVFQRWKSNFTRKLLI